MKKLFSVGILIAASLSAWCADLKLSDVTKTNIPVKAADEVLVNVKVGAAWTSRTTAASNLTASLNIADTNQNGIITSNQQPTALHVPYARHYGWNRPFGGWNTWYQNVTTMYPPNTYQDATNKVAWATNRINWAISQGVADYYNLVCFDDTWQNTNRLANGELWHDPAQFRFDGNGGWSGFTNMIRWMHGLGFRFGVYTEIDPTCAADIDGAGPRLPAPGSFGHYEQDARLWSSWGIDYVKLDAQLDATNVQAGFTRFINGWEATGRPLYVHGTVDYQQGFNGWTMLINEPRTPFSPDWTGYSTNDYWLHLVKHASFAIPMQPFVRPGFYPSGDILPGNQADGTGDGIDFELSRAQATVYTMLCMPRIYQISADPASQPKANWIQTNRAVLDIAMDGAVIGSTVTTNAGYTNKVVMVRPLGSASSQTKAVALWNLQTGASPTVTNIVCDWKTLGIPSNTVMQVTDIWSNRVFLATNYLAADVRFRAAELFKLTPYTTRVGQNETIRPSDWTLSTTMTRILGAYQATPTHQLVDGIIDASDDGYATVGFYVPDWVTNISGTMWFYCTNAAPGLAWTNYFDVWHSHQQPFVTSYSQFVYPDQARHITVTPDGPQKVSFSVPCLATNTVKWFQLRMSATTNAGTTKRWIVGPVNVTYQ